MSPSRYARPGAVRARALLRALVVALLLGAGPAALAQALISPELQEELDDLGLFETTTVIVTYDQTGPPTTAQRTALTALGITRGLTFRSIPTAAVLATRTQALAIAARNDVLSLWSNEEVVYYNDGSTQITGVDRLQADPAFRNADGLPYAGRGVTVLVNDSGVDATHGDLQFGSHVVENVQALTNLNAYSGLLPITYLEGIPNTDTNSGHGTHCAGTVGGTGAMSGGLYEGVAPGADLVGYGSGGALFILDALGGLDYAVTNRNSFEHPLRVVTNSWGSEGPFEHEDPVVQASYAAYRRGINVVFAAGNSGSGADTHNPYAVAPWVISVAAGDKAGLLADFSSRGVEGQTFTFEMPDGTTWTSRNEPVVTAPGVNVISARAITGTSNGGELDLELIAPEHLPFYTTLSGTSMATPHVAGIVALMLEAAPTLSPADVRRILRETATNMPGREAWEAGTGYVNAYAAVQAALGQTARPFGRTVVALNGHLLNANALVSVGAALPFELDFNPVGPTEEMPFEVAADISRVTAHATVEDNLVALVLIAPDGTEYGSAISLPVLGGRVAVTAPGMPGTWRLTVSGIGSVSGIPTDPLGITNGTSLPGTVAGELVLERTDGYTGLSDIAGHPAEGDIQYAVAYRLVDGFANGTYRPDRALRRIELAQYLVMGAGVRQYFPPDGGLTYSDLRGLMHNVAEPVTAVGAALRDRGQTHGGLMRASGSLFVPGGVVSRADLAYAFVQSLGLEEAAADYTGALTAQLSDGSRIPLADAAQVPAWARGHVQLAMDLALLDARIVTGGGGPVAYFDPNTSVARAAYATAAGRLFDAYLNGYDLAGMGDALVALPAPAVAEAEAAGDAVTLGGNVPNPFATSTTIRFALGRPTDVRLAVYDLTGREVARLVEGARAPGEHEVRWDARGLAAGVYVYRLQADGEVLTGRMAVAR